MSGRYSHVTPGESTSKTAHSVRPDMGWVFKHRKGFKIMKDHNDYSVMIQLLIDHELPEGDRVDLLTHIASSSCLRQLEEAESFCEMVRQACPRTEAPAALRERVVNLMANPENSISKELATSVPITQKGFAVRSYRWPVAAAAMVGIAVSGLLFISHLRRESRGLCCANLLHPEMCSFDH
jgi:hypothetical protein